MKKAFNLFSATLSKVFNDFVPFSHQVHRTFFTLAVLCAVAMMAGCKGEAEHQDTTDSNLLLGKWKCVAADCRWWADVNVDFFMFMPATAKYDTSTATLVAFHFIDTNRCVVTYHTHDCEPQLPYLINIDTVRYNLHDIHITTGGNPYVRPCDYEVEKLTRNTLVLRCFEHEEGEHYQMRYTFARK